jgi:hypothetical protein
LQDRAVRFESLLVLNAICDEKWNKELLGIDVNKTLEITKIYLEVKDFFLSQFLLCFPST